MSGPETMYEFDTATEVGADGGTTIHAGWDINGNANGGYLMALAARGMLAAAGRPDPITVTGHYLAPGKPGPARIDTHVVKQGRRFTTVTGQVVAGDRTVLQWGGAFGDLASAPAGYEHIDVGPPDLPSFGDCTRRSPQQGPVPRGLTPHPDRRIHPDQSGWVRGDRNGVPEMAGWFSFRDGRPIDTLALLLICDAFPPAVFHLDMPPGWVPTVEYTVHVRGVPAPGPVRCVFRSHFVQGGFLNEDGEVWDSTGRLVAQSRQLGLTPLTHSG